jgi:hypothetical protein
MRQSPANERVKELLRWLFHKPQFGFLGRIEYLSGHHRLFYPYGGGPMNGQTARLEIARSIIQHCGVAQVVETGTYRGTTTRWLAQFGLPVVTAEISPRYAAFSRARLRNEPNVELRLRDSVTVLTEMSRNVGCAAPMFFYLDAHWRTHLPLKEELDIIGCSFPKAIVMIDDFQVPGDSGYGYDDYGPGKVLDLSLLSNCNVLPDVVFFPSVNSKWETGGKRGCVVLAYDPAAIVRLKEMPLLRPCRMRDAASSPDRSHQLVACS